MHLKCNTKVLLIECSNPGLDARSQFQAFALLKSDMTSLDPGVAIARFAAFINCTIVSQLQRTNQICPFFLSL